MNVRKFIIFVKIELCEHKTWCYFRNLLYLAMMIIFRFPQNRPSKAVWGIFCYHMQRHKKNITLAIKSLDLFRLICDHP